MFTIAFVLLMYIWVGYPLMLWVLWKLHRPKIVRHACELPKVSIILAVRHEEEKIAGKLANCGNLDYPPHQMEILVVVNGSTDRTEDIIQEAVKSDGRIHLLDGRKVVGK